MAEKRDNPKQDPVEGSRDTIERELKRQGDSKAKGESGAPARRGGQIRNRRTGRGTKRPRR